MCGCACVCRDPSTAGSAHPAGAAAVPLAGRQGWRPVALAGLPAASRVSCVCVCVCRVPAPSQGRRPSSGVCRWVSVILCTFLTLSVSVCLFLFLCLCFCPVLSHCLFLCLVLSSHSMSLFFVSVTSLALCLSLSLSLSLSSSSVVPGRCAVSRTNELSRSIVLHTALSLGSLRLRLNLAGQEATRQLALCRLGVHRHRSSCAGLRPAAGRSFAARHRPL